jgi:predicted transcriptional regulator
MSPQQWAKVPESAAYMGLDATAWNVLVILASKAGRERTAWITQQTMGDRLGLSRTTISKAIHRLEKLDLVRRAGKVVVDHERGTWVYKYNVAPYLPVVTPVVTSGIEERGPDVNERGPDVTLGLPDVNLGGPDATDQARPVAHSVPQ